MQCLGTCDIIEMSRMCVAWHCHVMSWMLSHMDVYNTDIDGFECRDVKHLTISARTRPTVILGCLV